MSLNPLLGQILQTAFQAGIDIAKRHFEETGQMLTDAQAKALRFEEIKAGQDILKARADELGLVWPE